MEEIRQVMAQKLKEKRKEAGINVDTAGAYISRSGKTISAWEVGRGQPDADQLVMLCRLYGAKLSDFYGEDAFTDDAFTDVPIYGHIAAGTPIEMIEIDDTHPVPTEIVNRYKDPFLLKVDGESMNSILPNRCYALIEPCTEVDRPNQPYAVCVNGYDATIKRVKPLNNGFELVPDSTDPTYLPKTYNYNEEGTEKITIIGRVVYYVLPYDWEF